MPVLGAAGLSLSLASGASAASGGAAAEVLTRNTGVTQEITLREEEICDVSLATFYVFDKDSVGRLRPRLRLAAWRRLSLWQPASRHRLRNTNAEQCQSAVSFDQALTQIHARS